GGRGAAGAAQTAAPNQAAAQFGGRGIASGVNDTAMGLYRTDDSGATWHKVNNEDARPMYFSQVRVDPNDPDVVFMAGVKLHLTTDGGKTINTNVTRTAHDDVHAIWIDPSNSRHVMIGDDGGLAQTFDQAKTWLFFPNLPVGLFYHVSYDMSVPYNVCGGMQDNYDWCGPSQVRSTPGIANYQWTTLQGGDGFVVLQDPKENRVIYSETQDGNMVRVDRTTDETESIRPIPAPGEPPYRWNWDTPFVMSPTDPAVVYTAAQKVFRSPDRGLTWTAISPDLTSNENRDDIVTMGLKGSDITISKDDGISAWPTIVSLAESPKHPGLIYAGTDDGNLQVTKDGGKNWMKVYDKLPNAPKGAWVSRIAPSRFDEGTVYVTIDDHRQNNFGTYVYVSTDYGQTWKSLAGNLGSFGEVVLKCVTEDQKNPDVLYLGAETGLFISVDRGQTWYYPHTNLPDVRIDEITLHPRDNAMLLATHGRAIWILDHLEPIQEYAAAQKTEAKLFTPAPSSMYRRPANDRNYEFWGDQTFFGENPPQEAVISYYLKNKATAVSLKITDAAGRDIRDLSGPVLAKADQPGINAACWDLRVDPNPAPPGAEGRGGRGGRGGGENSPPAQNPFGAGCAEGGGRGGGGFGGGGVNPGPWVLAGTYNVSLIVDGKTVDTKPLRVADDPDVGLTAMQRKQMFDMAMEMHELQRRATEASEAVASLNRQMGELSPTIEGRSDMPADVKTSFDALKKQVADVMPQLAAPAGRGFGGGGRGGGAPTVAGKIAQAKNGMMGGLWPTAQTLKTYSEAKVDAPKMLAAANTAIAQAQTVSASLAKYNVTLTVPAPIAAPAAKAAKKK
ncbi:MAG: WD40/YVTN/BNR-like repeat-containing protein, partial [Vicinamibacterales bacterium]